MSPLPVGHGIISVVQTPFDERGAVDEASLVRLVEETLACGVNGFLVPVVASEVAELTADERRRIVRLVAATVRGAVRLIVGASSDDPKQCVEQALVASEIDAAAYLVAVPAELYGQPHRIVPFFREVIGGAGDLPLVIQDLEFNGPGMDPRTIAELKETLPTLAGRTAGVDRPGAPPFLIDYGIQIETVPRLSYARVLAGDFDATAVAGRRVIVGATAVELGDVMPHDGQLGFRFARRASAPAVAGNALVGRELHALRGLADAVRVTPHDQGQAPRIPGRARE